MCSGEYGGRSTLIFYGRNFLLSNFSYAEWLNIDSYVKYFVTLFLKSALNKVYYHINNSKCSGVKRTFLSELL